MADAPRSPLEHLAGRLGRVAELSRGAVTASEVSRLSQVSLRVAPDLLDLLPFDVPVETNTATSDAGRDVLWLGPDEWLVVTGASAYGALSSITDSLAGHHHAAVDVGANRAVVELRGDGRRVFLSTRCPIDLDRRTWRDGRCAQTTFGRAPVLLHEREGATRLYVRPSYGSYVTDLLVAAAATLLE
jgi:sarcosine oxidase subunit gamma